MFKIVSRTIYDHKIIEQSLFKFTFWYILVDANLLAFHILCSNEKIENVQFVLL